MYAYDTALDAVAAIDRLGFDCPFTIDADGIVQRDADAYPPTVTTCHGRPDNWEDLEVDNDAWSVVGGLTRPDDHSGLIAPDGQLTVDMVRALGADQGDDPTDGRLIFCLVVVGIDCCEQCPPFDACDRDHGNAGWAIVSAPDPTVRMYDHQADDAFADYVDETHPTVTIMGMDYDAGRLFRMGDPAGFTACRNDWADALGIVIV